MSSPLFAIAEKLLKMQSLYPQQPIVERALFHAKSKIDAAGAYLALWCREGREPVPVAGEALSPFLREAVAIVRAFLESLQQYEVGTPDIAISKEFAGLLGCMSRLTVGVFGGLRGASYMQTEPSQEAKRQAREYAEKHGIIHHRGRVVHRGEVCGVFDQRLPKHW